jgi:hypothetical protein
VIDDEIGGPGTEILAEARHPTLELVQNLHELPVPALGQLQRLAVPVGHVHVLDALARQQLLELRLLLDVAQLRSELDPVERRGRHVDVPALDELLHLPVEEREDERADVRPVHIGVRHHDDPVVAELLDVELVRDAGADRGDDRLDLLVRQDLVDPVLLRVDDLAAEREDRLVAAVARVDRRPAGGHALDEEELRGFRVGDLAVGEPARE